MHELFFSSCLINKGMGKNVIEKMFFISSIISYNYWLVYFFVCLSAYLFSEDIIISLLIRVLENFFNVEFCRVQVQSIALYNICIFT